MNRRLGDSLASHGRLVGSYQLHVRTNAVLILTRHCEVVVRLVGHPVVDRPLQAERGGFDGLEVERDDRDLCEGEQRHVDDYLRFGIQAVL